jgi:hypothetical protein
VKATPSAPVAAGHPPAWRCDPGGRTIALLPEAFDAWLESMPPGAPGRDPLGTPWVTRSRVSACGTRPAGVAELRVDAPAAGSVFLLDPGGSDQQALTLEASVSGGDAASRPAMVEFMVDGEVVARSAPPFRARVAMTPGDHEVTARPVDGRLAVRLGVSRFSVR